MKIWLITVGEPLPLDEKWPRYLRTGILARRLVDAGHEVTWWSSTFNHIAKRYRCAETTTMKTAAGYRLILLHGRAYLRNISLNRIRNHREMAREFVRLAESEPLPDVIVCSFPTIELSEAATRFGKKHGVKVVLDVRDLWPDIFVSLAPGPLRPLARLPLTSLFCSTQNAFRSCDAIVGTSGTYLDFGLRYAGRRKAARDCVIPLGYEPPAVSVAERSLASRRLIELGVDERRTVCWFVGVFGTTYDLVPVIEAARKLRDEGKDQVQFVLSGEGERGGAWLGLGQGLDNVIFTGWIGGAELAWLRSIAHIGLAAYAPGAPQSLPNKIFEYLSAGIPLLSSLDGEAAELLSVHEAGFAYLAGDSESLLQSLGKLTSDETLRCRMGQNAKRLFDEQFATDIVFRGYVTYLESFSASR